MTLTLSREEILALPAGRDTDALVAQHVLGWKWWARRTAAGSDTYLCFIAPPDWHPSQVFSGDWTVSFRPADGTGERYTDWARASGRAALLPSVTEFDDDALVVLDSLRERFRQVNIHWVGGLWRVRLYASGDDLAELTVDATETTLALAICRAALLAVITSM